jgi:hypothetical protein
LRLLAIYSGYRTKRWVSWWSGRRAAGGSPAEVTQPKSNISLLAWNKTLALFRAFVLFSAALIFSGSRLNLFQFSGIAVLLRFSYFYKNLIYL